MTRSILGVAVAIAALAGSPASAAPADTVSGTVSIAGLDLSNPVQQAAMQKRIRHVAWTICGHRDQSGPPEMALRERRCVKEAIASAQPQLDRAVTYALARKRGPEAVALASRR